jgi:hypothetical protein
MKEIKIETLIATGLLVLTFAIYYFDVIHNLNIMFTILVAYFSFIFTGTLYKLYKAKQTNIINDINRYLSDELVKEDRRSDHKVFSLNIYKEQFSLLKYVFFAALIITNLFLMVAHLMGIYNYVLFTILG